MSSNNNDLEGDDIWGDSGSGGAAEESKHAEEESKETHDGGDDDDDDDEEEEEQSPESLEDSETRHMSNGELRQRIHLLNNDIRVMKSDVQRITHESRGQRDRIRENQEKVKLNKQLPYLVANVVEILEPDAEDGESVMIDRATRHGPCQLAHLVFVYLFVCSFLASFLPFFLPCPPPLTNVLST